jgi:O-antigen/teichoic acid export membrane protein
MGTVAAKVVGFVNILLILSHLTVYEYGLTELVFSVVSTVGLFLLPGLAATVTADLGVERAQEEYGKMKALFLEFFALNIILGIIAWAVLFFGSTIVAELSGNVLVDKFFKIVSFTFLVSPLRLVSTMLATVMTRYADQSFFGVVEEIAKGGFLAMFFFWLDRGADGLLWATVLAPCVAIALYAPRTLSAYRVFSNAHPDRIEPLWRALREHRKWSVASTYANVIGKNIRLWIIKLMLGTEAVGLYAFAVGIYAHASSITTLQPALTPVVPRYVTRPELLARILSASSKYQLAISFLVLAGSVVVLPFFIYLAFPHYAGATLLSAILLLLLIPNGIGANLTPVFVALREQRTLFFSILLRIGSVIALLPICIYFWGLTGAGIEAVLTMCITVAERMYRIKRLLPGVTFFSKTFSIADPAEKQIMDEILQRFRLAPFTVWFRRSDS